MAGFTFRYRLSGGAPTIQNLIAKNTATYYKGDIVNLESGEVDNGAAADTDLVGVVLATTAATDSVTPVPVITDADAVYAATDANAREQGAILDLAPTAGSQGLAADSSHTFLVVAKSSATEETLVTFNVAKHWLT